MLTFISSILLTAFIASCFYKKTFWENRLKVLIIGAGVALVATLAVNYIVRPNLPEVTTIKNYHSIRTLYLNVDHFDSLSPELVKYNDFNITNERYETFDKAKSTDSVVKKMSHVLLSRTIDSDNDTTMYINYISSIAFEKVRLNCSRVYFAKSADENAYITDLEVTRKSNSLWITNYSIPTREINHVIVLPTKEYDIIPDRYKGLPDNVDIEVFTYLAQK